MPTILRGLFLIAAMMLSGRAAVAAPDLDSANYTMPGCRDFAKLEKNNTDFMLQGFCAGTINTLLGMGPALLGFCRPPNSTTGQAVRVIVQYIDNRPARLHARTSDTGQPATARRSKRQSA